LHRLHVGGECVIANATLLLTIVITAGVFAGAGYLGIELSRIVSKGARAPGEGQKPEPPVAWFLVGSAALGAVIALHGLDWQALALNAVICVSLVGCWHGAITHGRMSDYFTLVPTAAIALSAIAQSNWPLLVGIVVPFTPFAAMAYLSKGKGMGWDDAKLAALGGAVLGTTDALLAYATACVVAVSVAALRKQLKEPIVFGPYVIGAIGLSLAFRVV
jgi:prepilin signal peptidase PulO-like enzyme (type II secretory pathway)